MSEDKMYGWSNGWDVSPYVKKQLDLSYGNLMGLVFLAEGSLKNKYVETFIPKKVIYNGKTTVVYWKDDSKTLVTASDNEVFSEEAGLAMAIAKKVFGNNRSAFLKVVKNAYRQPEKEEKKKKPIVSNIPTPAEVKTIAGTATITTNVIGDTYMIVDIVPSDEPISVFDNHPANDNVE